MLESLHIENIAVIDRLDVALGRGFHVLTGETGAGKSILIDAIGMLLGGRSAKGLIRHGESRALVQGLFRVDSPDAAKRLARLEMSPDEDGSLLLARELHADGHTVCRVNGRMTTVGALRAAGAVLVNIHGQHDSQALLDETTHITFLDKFAWEDIRPCMLAYAEWYNKTVSSRKALAALQMDEKEKQHRLEVLTYEINEIESAGLRAGEEEELLAKRDLINNAKRLTDALAGALEALNGETSAYTALSDAGQRLAGIAALDNQLAAMAETVAGLAVEAEEAARDVRAYLEALPAAQGDIGAVEDRLDLIYTLKRKYGGDISHILEYYEKISEEYRRISTSDAEVKRLKSELAGYMRGLTQAGDALREARLAAAARLAEAIRGELAYLDMGGVGFSVEVTPAAYGRTGADAVRFLIATNPGQPPKPLPKIVSGGELSRIMLAMKSVLADSDMVETLIFDEIDTGVSGRAAQKIGNRMWALARKKQVLCITHQAAIAALADRHSLIEKHVADGQTATTVRELTAAERVSEVARIIGGDNVTDTTRAQAQEMIARGAAEAAKGGENT